jgi:hypothetical protein
MFICAQIKDLDLEKGGRPLKFSFVDYEFGKL